MPWVTRVIQYALVNVGSSVISACMCRFTYVHRLCIQDCTESKIEQEGIIMLKFKY